MMSDALLTELMEAVPEPMLHLSQGGQVLRANSAARALLGNWIEGRSYASVLRQPSLLGRIEAAFADGQPGEARLQRTERTGETQYRVKITPIGPADARGQHDLALYFTDITHLREAEEMRRDFVANVSHELRTPLTAVMGFIETLRGPARDDVTARERFLGIMEGEARRMNRLVSDLLSLSRVESQERQRPSDDVDLGAVLRGVIAALRPAAEEQACELVLDIRPPAPELALDTAADVFRLKGDRDQLMQVFLNLTENALKYGGRGKTVTIGIGWQQGMGAMPGPLIVADVTDQGEGIDPLHIPRLTERFYRVDTHRSRAMGGTGLGLAIVKHIINRHRGRLRIESRQGEGSVFTVILPRD
jgi:two-component system, OmpR family, phosphate regulon sensor histidine kinase PhoR